MGLHRRRHAPGPVARLGGRSRRGRQAAESVDRWPIPSLAPVERRRNRVLTCGPGKSALETLLALLLVLPPDRGGPSATRVAWPAGTPEAAAVLARCSPLRKHDVLGLIGFARVRRDRRTRTASMSRRRCGSLTGPGPSSPVSAAVRGWCGCRDDALTTLRSAPAGTAPASSAGRGLGRSHAAR
jgi:hypothetical protein